MYSHSVKMDILDMASAGILIIWEIIFEVKIFLLCEILIPDKLCEMSNFMVGHRSNILGL